MASKSAGGSAIVDKEHLRSIARELQLERSTSRPVLFHGPTMLPLLRDGDGLEIVPVRAEEIQLGDIVVYREQEKYPTRRVVGFNPARTEFFIQADYTPARLFCIPATALLGRVEARLRGGKRLHRTSARWRWAAWSVPYRKKFLQIFRRNARRR